jgi:hypothetical protein
MFEGGVWGTRLGSDVPQRRHEQNTFPKRSIRRDLGDALGDTAGDALTTFVSVLSNLVSPRYRRSSEWRYLPLYLGLLTILRAVLILEKIEFLQHGICTLMSH